MSASPPSSDDWRDRVESSFTRGRRESRHRSRRICNIPARLWIPGDPSERPAVVRNLSDVGAFLETEPLPVGTRFQVRLVRGETVEVRDAEVLWLKAPGPSARCRTLHGVGVRFTAEAHP